MMIGMPECKANIFECVAYLAMAPKSNAMDVAIAKADEIIDKTGALPVPLHIRNAPTKLMENLGYGKGYIYNPDYDDDDPRVLAQTYFPEELLVSYFYLFFNEVVVVVSVFVFVFLTCFILF